MAPTTISCTVKVTKHPLPHKQLCVLCLVGTLSEIHPCRDKNSIFPWVIPLHIFRGIKRYYDIHHGWERRVEKKTWGFEVNQWLSPAQKYFDTSLKTNVGSGGRKLEKYFLSSSQPLFSPSSRKLEARCSWDSKSKGL